ncbi:hypothetical protein HETIRDRAFT_381711 [Heterobasidion irregulare TC 32-1]|uniref:DUF1742-domain-containing protein n=1 Tax=Heterobasidion irregulare (strain TC 32-1) TaxID=747525 RepID=W4KEI5_HETIT|nr:uncharacterized protein HETIRDRAFT_381711 [Heterobasidion irregulare TC 32-1]ETW84257.1 hypothetical protein HETIRDRAFT_381711 [Heterobasidion irregulare TC 32-1]
MSFTNVYYKRATATPKACFVCYKPTTTVLATASTIDFIYVCTTHLSDPGFATQLGESRDGIGASAVKKIGLSAEEIAKVKEEWEEKQRLKKEKAEQKKDKDAVKDEGTGKDKSQTKDSANTPSPSTPSAPTPTAATTPSHERYSLHRDFFAMRLAEHRKRRQTKQMQELAPRLPGAPRNPIP